MKIIYASVECYPFIKTGGLGDVAYSFPRSLKKLNHDVKVFLIYSDTINKKYKDNMELIYKFNLNINNFSFETQILHLNLDDIDYYFVKEENTININKTAYLDLHEDAMFYFIYNKAIAKFLELSNYNPDIIHINDWHTGILPLFLKKQKHKNKFLKIVFTIHNLQYQGAFGSKRILRYFNEDEKNNKFLNEIISFDVFNFMKAGIILSDIITTVSETYKKEIQQPLFGMGLDSLLQKNAYKLKGIINGLDDKIFNPSIDKYISKKYKLRNYKKSKLINKKELQKISNMEVNENKFLVGIISRLVNQKGIDLIINSLSEIMKNNDIQIIILGTGDINYESNLISFGKHNQKNYKFYNKFSNELSHKIYAGVDALAIPSLFEPCGLTQLISLKYGVVPIARETGGLADTIIPIEKNNPNGFLFKEYSPEAFTKEINKAKKIYYDNNDFWHHLIKTGMSQKFDWDEITKIYVESAYKNEK